MYNFKPEKTKRNRAKHGKFTNVFDKNKPTVHVQMFAACEC